MPPRVAIIGAGPIGIAAALGALERRCSVVLFDRGRAGDSLRTWGPTRFFSPMRMNVSRCMRELLGRDMPADDAMLTGPEYADSVLAKLVAREPLRDCVREHHNVVAVARRGMTRCDYAGHPLRSERPFTLLVERSAGSPAGAEPAESIEQTIEADVVLDASGAFSIPRPFGAGGLPARGERNLRRPPIRTLGDLHAQRDAIRGKRLLLIGHGHSAANALGLLEELGGTQVTWAVRSANRRPCEEVANDPLPERRRVVESANALAESPPPWLTVERRTMVESVSENGVYDVTFTGGRAASFDVIAAFTGHRPDSQHIRELAVETSPVTEGGARLYRAISCITDCLSVPRVQPADLQSGESNFYFVGARSYGRARTFLLQSGLAQLETILEGLR